VGRVYHAEDRGNGFFIRTDDGRYLKLAKSIKQFGERYSLDIPPYGVIVEFCLT